ncbi:MAG: SHOCT domain-containing protein, partial [Deltaproteobacteria bacterium]|nr:SHOCT domain-containing protein [Deltaproteobacteria bacterium]
MGRQDGDGLVKSVMVAYFVLVLHVFLIIGLGLVVIFFSGIVQYMLWIFLTGVIIILASLFYFYRRMKAEGRTLRQMMQSPMFNGRPVEVSLLGGLASFRVGSSGRAAGLGADIPHPSNQLE